MDFSSFFPFSPPPQGYSFFKCCLYPGGSHMQTNSESSESLAQIDTHPWACPHGCPPLKCLRITCSLLRFPSLTRSNDHPQEHPHSVCLALETIIKHPMDQEGAVSGRLACAESHTADSPSLWLTSSAPSCSPHAPSTSCPHLLFLEHL